MRTKRILTLISSWLVLVLAIPLVASCTKVPEAGTSLKPTKPLTLTIAKTDLGMETWTVTKASGTYEASIVGNVNESLINRRPGTLTLVPGLAESWEPSADGKTWTFNLRRGIKWHDDWGEFTAEDVKFSLELAGSKESTNNRAGWLRSTIESIEIVNPYKVNLHLKTLSVAVPYYLANFVGTLYMMSKKYVEQVGMEKAAEHPIGTGPWKFVEQKVGDYVKFEAVKDHWRQAPAFDYLIMRKVPEESTRIAMLRAGEADIVEMSPMSKKEVEAAGFQFKRVPGGSFAQINLGGMILPTRKTYDPTVPWAGPDPAKALKVRKAMNLAVNKQAIIDRILMGEAEPVFLGGAATTQESPWMDPNWKPYPYDPQEAKRLLAEAGYPNGFELTMWEFPMPGTPWTADIAEAVAMDWEKIGIRVKREITTYDRLRPLMPDRNLAWRTWGFRSLVYDEPQDFVWIALHTKSTAHWGYESATLDDLANKAAVETNFQKRVELNRQIVAHLYDNYVWVPIATTVVIYGVSNKVGEWPQIQGNPYPHYFEYITVGRGQNN